MGQEWTHRVGVAHGQACAQWLGGGRPIFLLPLDLCLWVILPTPTQLTILALGEHAWAFPLFSDPYCPKSWLASLAQQL